jgi:hypothetical protein
MQGDMFVGFRLLNVIMDCTEPSWYLQAHKVVWTEYWTQCGGNDALVGSTAAMSSCGAFGTKVNKVVMACNYTRGGAFSHVPSWDGEQ